MIPEIPMLSQPLVTEEGFLNEACMNELASVISSIPKTYERLKSDPEWSMRYWTIDTHILGSLAKTAVELFNGCPPNLQEILEYLKVMLRRDIFTEKLEEDNFRMAELSLCEINKCLWDTIGELDMFVEWNNSDKYENWIDLDACLHGVCIQIRNERRHNHAFDCKFEREHGKI